MTELAAWILRFQEPAEFACRQRGALTAKPVTERSIAQHCLPSHQGSQCRTDILKKKCGVRLGSEGRFELGVVITGHSLNPQP